jgi:5'-3' exonuclease
VPGPLLAVDGPSILYRAFYGLPDKITDDEGRSVNALLGMTNMLLFVIEKYAPRATVLCFGEEAADYRTELYPAYHADRDAVPDKLTWQWEQVDAYFPEFGFEIENAAGLEADDLLGAFAQVEEKAGGRALLLTGDRDMYQCATDDVTVLYARTVSGGQGPDEVTPEEVVKRYGVPPEAVPDFIALRGDPSDGLPGAKGIGEKTAADLLRRHGTLEGVIDAAIREKPGVRKAIIGHEEELGAFKRIATLQPAKVKRPKDTPVDFERGAKAAHAHGMHRLGQRLEQLAATE